MTDSEIEKFQQKKSRLPSVGTHFSGASGTSPTSDGGSFRSLRNPPRKSTRATMHSVKTNMQDKIDIIYRVETTNADS